MKSQIIKGSFLIILTALVILAIKFTHFKTDISAFFIAGDNAEEILLANEIQSGALSRRTILSIGSLEKKHLPSVFSDELIIALKSIPGVANVWKLGKSHNAIKALESLYVPFAAQLYSRNPDTDLTELLSIKGLTERAISLKAALISPGADFVKKVAIHDPLLLTLTGFKSQFATLQASQAENHPYQNIILETTASGMDVPEQTRIQQAIKTEFSKLSARNNSDNLTYQLDMTGVPIFASATQNMIQADVQFISTFSTIALGLIFIWIFRSLSVFFWVSCLLVTVVTVSIIVTNLLFGSIHGLSLAIGGTLAGICIDYPIHALVHAQAVEKHKRVKAIATIWPSMLLGGFTTIIGYIALGYSGYPGFQQVAVFAGTGMITALLLTRFVLPYLITGITKTYYRQHFTYQWIALCKRFRPALLIMVLFFSGISIFTLSSIHWLQDLQQLTPELDYLKVKDAEIRSRMLSIEPGRFVLVSALSVEDALQRAELVYQELDKVKAAGQLSTYFGLYPWILSEHQQFQNAKLLQEKLTVTVKQNWQKALKNKGLSIEKLGSLDYKWNHSLSLQEVLASPVGHLLDNQIVISPQRTLIIIWLSEHQPDVLKKALLTIPGTQYFSQRDLLNSLSVSYQQNAFIYLVAGLIAIVIVLVVRYKNVGKALLTLAPALAAMLLLLGLWALNGLTLSFLHLVGFLMVIAICADYGIFYRENPDTNISLTYQAIFVSMLTNVGAFGCLYFVETSILITLSKIVMYGLVLGFFLCPIFITHPEHDNVNN